MQRARVEVLGYQPSARHVCRIVRRVVAPVYVVVVTVRSDAVEPGGEPGEDDRGDDEPADRAHAGRVVAGIALVLLAVCAGMGWLYLLREAGELDAGPRLSGALPLEQLARGDDQPLLRVAVAWVPAGVAAGVALAWATGWGRLGRTMAIGLLAFVVLFVSGAVSDAVAVNETVVSKLGDQFSHGGIWIEVVCLVIGSLSIGRRTAAGSRGSV